MDKSLQCMSQINNINHVNIMNNYNVGRHQSIKKNPQSNMNPKYEFSKDLGKEENKSQNEKMQLNAKLKGENGGMNQSCIILASPSFTPSKPNPRISKKENEETFPLKNNSHEEKMKHLKAQMEKNMHIMNMNNSMTNKLLLNSTPKSTKYGIGASHNKYKHQIPKLNLTKITHPQSLIQRKSINPNHSSILNNA